jgi:TRAP-type mannitol/chloroaromatic compound transport system permease small subunit
MSIFLWFGWKFAYDSWLEKERAITSAWMPPIYPLKMVMVVAIVFLLLQGISEFLKNLHVFLRGERP